MEWNVLHCFVLCVCILSPKQTDSHHQIHVIILLYHQSFPISHYLSLSITSSKHFSLSLTLSFSSLTDAFLSSHRESHDTQRLASAHVTNNFTHPSRSTAPKYSESPAIIKIPVYPKKKSKWVPKNKTVNDQISR